MFSPPSRGPQNADLVAALQTNQQFSESHKQQDSEVLAIEAEAIRTTLEVSKLNRATSVEEHIHG